MTNEEFLESISLEGEIWKPVVGYEGLYVVSNLGRIASLNRSRRFDNGQIRCYKAMLLKPLMRNPYLSVSLCNEHKKICEHIHRIVATAFIPNSDNLGYIDHIDGNPLNNVVSNLRWCSQSTNMSNPIFKDRHSRTWNKIGVSWLLRKVACLKDGEIVKIYPNIQAAADEGFSADCISRVIRGKVKTHLSFTWKLLPDENL